MWIFKKIAKTNPKITRRVIIIVIVLLRDLRKSLLQSAPTPSAGREKPPIIIATILAIGIKTIAGRKMIAWAGFTVKAKRQRATITERPFLIYNIEYI